MKNIMSGHLRNLLDDYFQVKAINLFLDTLRIYQKMQWSHST
jgi:hypothetical protein